MKYNVLNKTRKKNKKAVVGLCLIICGIAVILVFFNTYIKSIIEGYPMSVGTGEMTKCMDLAMANVSESGIYDIKKIDNVIYDSNGNVMSVECDTATITKIKTEYIKQLSKIISEKGNDLHISVPLGTLIGNEYTLGVGPEIKFKLRYSTTINAKLVSKFYDAGINNTLHQISLVAENTVYIIIPWAKCSKIVSTQYILSETVISGKVPDAYTNVYEGNGDVVGDIFDYGAEVEK